jgi:hypothetical protein
MSSLDLAAEATDSAPETFAELDLFALRDETLSAVREIKDPVARVSYMSALAAKRFGAGEDRDEVLAEAAGVARGIKNPDLRAKALFSVLLSVK